MFNILYIEDDIKYANKLINSINNENFKFMHVASAQQFMKIGDYASFDLILSDLYLQDMDSYELLKVLDKVNLPIIIISSSDNSSDELEVFTHNIQEYISKDSLFKTIEFRIAKVLEVYNNLEINYEIDGVKYYLLEDTSIVTNYDGEIHVLTNREFKILRYLLTHPNETISRQDLYYEAFMKKLEKSEERVVDVYITRLRSKLGIYQIQSVRGKGYRWIK